MKYRRKIPLSDLRWSPLPPGLAPSLARSYTIPSALTHTYGPAQSYAGQMWSTCSADVDKGQEKKENHQLRHPTFSPQLCGAEADGGERPRWTHKWLIPCFSAVEKSKHLLNFFKSTFLVFMVITPDNWTSVKVSPVMRKLARLVTPALPRGPAPGHKHTGKTIRRRATSQSPESWSRGLGRAAGSPCSVS